MYMYKEDLALNNLQMLTCHKIQTRAPEYQLPYLKQLKEKGYVKTV